MINLRTRIATARVRTPGPNTVLHWPQQEMPHGMRQQKSPFLAHWAERGSPTVLIGRVAAWATPKMTKAEMRTVWKYIASY